MSFWWLFAVFCCSLALTAFVRLYALKTHMVDVPNQRSSHFLPTPRGGGLAIIVTFLIGTLCLFHSGMIKEDFFLAICLPGSLIGGIGLIDDHKNLSAKFRFIFHVISSVVALYFIGEIPELPFMKINLEIGWLGYPLAAFFLVWSLNLYNFMDGIDGIAGIEAITVAGGAALILWINQDNSGFSFLLLMLCAATGGFLCWNWPPAKIFMGDGGSGFLGFILFLLALITSQSKAINIWSWLILYGVFWVDATVTLISRLIRGCRFYEAHRSHAYQVISRKWGSHLKVDWCVFAINIFWLFPLAFLSARFEGYAVVYSFIALTPLFCLSILINVSNVKSRIG